MARLFATYSSSRINYSIKLLNITANSWTKKKKLLRKIYYCNKLLNILTRTKKKFPSYTPKTGSFSFDRNKTRSTVSFIISILAKVLVLLSRWPIIKSKYFLDLQLNNCLFSFSVKKSLSSTLLSHRRQTEIERKNEKIIIHKFWRGYGIKGIPSPTSKFWRNLFKILLFKEKFFKNFDHSPSQIFSQIFCPIFLTKLMSRVNKKRWKKSKKMKTN